VAAKEPDQIPDLASFFIDACVARCRQLGPKYTEGTRQDLIKAIAANPDPKSQLDQNRMLVAVEALLDQQELPLEERAP
jgi:hypothetical protein